MITTVRPQMAWPMLGRNSSSPPQTPSRAWQAQHDADQGEDGSDYQREEDLAAEERRPDGVDLGYQPVDVGSVVRRGQPAHPAQDALGVARQIKADDKRKDDQQDDARRVQHISDRLGGHRGDKIGQCCGDLAHQLTHSKLKAQYLDSSIRQSGVQIAGDADQFTPHVDDLVDDGRGQQGAYRDHQGQ
jgi:hypothetical protein